jgi:hypothetical protein
VQVRRVVPEAVLPKRMLCGRCSAYQAIRPLGFCGRISLVVKKGQGRIHISNCIKGAANTSPQADG